jgi:hypothetical protein
VHPFSVGGDKAASGSGPFHMEDCGKRMRFAFAEPGFQDKRQAVIFIGVIVSVKPESRRFCFEKDKGFGVSGHTYFSL